MGDITAEVTTKKNARPLLTLTEEMCIGIIIIIIVVVGKHELGIGLVNARANSIVVHTGIRRE